MLDPAWSELVSDVARRESTRLVAIARAEGLVRDDALDAVQDALATLLRFAGAERIAADPDELRRYLAALVRNHARNARRRHHRARPHVDVDHIDDGADASPEVTALVHEQIARAEGCMAGLALVQRRVVELRVLEELAGPDVARQLDLAPGHVAVLLHRARAALARCMADENLRTAL